MGTRRLARLPPSVDTLEVERRLDDLRVLARLEGLADSPALFDEILEYVYRHLRDVLPYDRMSLVVLEPDDTLRMLWARSASGEQLMPPDYAVPLAETGLEGVVHGLSPRLIDDLEEHHAGRAMPAHSRMLLGEGMHSSLACPLVLGGEPVGVLFFSSHLPRAFELNHAHRFELVARHLAELVHQGRGHQAALARRALAERELRQELSPETWRRWRSHHDASVSQLGKALLTMVRASQRALRELELLDAITERVNAGLTLDEVLDYVYVAFGKLIPYDRIGFARIVGEGSQLRAVACWSRSASPDTQLPVGYTASLRGSSLERIVRTGQPRIINDLVAYLQAHPRSDSTRRIVADGMRSSLTCPLVALGRPVGFLFFSSAEADSYSPEHVASFERIAQRLAVIVEKGRIHQEVVEERERSEALLHSILPPAIARRIKDGEQRVADLHPSATVLFADLVGFSAAARDLPAAEVVDFLDRLFSRFDVLARHHEVEKIKTLGDGYLAVAGLPVARPDHAHAAARLALDMVESLYELDGPGGVRLDLRVGLHSGPVVAGVIGRHKFRYDIWGDAVNLGSRMERTAPPGRVLISKATADLLGDAFRLRPHGLVETKGLGPVETWLLEGPVYA